MNAPATPINALVMMPRVDPENWRASHDGPASRSNKKPAMTPIARTRRNVTPGSVACMDQAALSGLDLKVACAIVVAVPWRRNNSADAIIWKHGTYGQRRRFENLSVPRLGRPEVTD